MRNKRIDIGFDGPGALHVRRALCLFALALIPLLALATPASAKKTHLLTGTFGSASQPSFPGGTGNGVSALTVDDTSGDLFVLQKGYNERQRLELSGQVTGGSYTLTFAGQTTVPLNVTAGTPPSASAVETALSSLSTIGAGNISVNSNFELEFTGSLGQTDVPQTTCTSSLTGTAPACSITTTRIGTPNSILRFKPNGEPDPFSALGSNALDAKAGPGGKACGEEAASCDKTPQSALAAGTSTNENDIAIDNSGTATDGNIYVTQGQQAAGNLVDIFAADGHFLGQLTAAGTTKFGTTGSFPFSPCGVAVDAAGNLFIAGGYDNKIYKFDPSANPPLNSDHVATFPTPEPVCKLAAGAGSLFVNAFSGFKAKDSVFTLDSATGTRTGVVESGEAHQVSVDPATGHVYVVATALSNNHSPVNPTTLKEYDASGSSLLSTVDLSNPDSIVAPDKAGILYVVSGKAKVEVYGPLVTVPDVVTGAAAITGDTSVTLNGTVNPDGTALQECHFEYLDDALFQEKRSLGYQAKKIFAEFSVKGPCAESPAEIGLSAKPVHLSLSGLSTETLYHYRLVATNANAALYPLDPAATATGADLIFKTPSKPAISAQWAQGVGTGEATLKATLIPENSPTTYHVEWGPTTAYGQISPDLPIGSGEAAKTVSLTLSDLSPDTIYHYRFVAVNGIGVSEGPDHSLLTYPLPASPKADCPNQAFRSGASAPLPDCRAYEMVSPLDKEGGDVAAVASFDGGAPARLDQGASDGESITYSSYRAFANAPSAPYTSQYMARRDPAEGWQSEPISLPRGGPSTYQANPAPKLDTLYKAFSDDLCDGYVLGDTEPLMAEGAIAGFPNAYRRQNCAGDNGRYEALLGGGEVPTIDPSSFNIVVQGFSADGTHTVFTAGDKLSDQGTPGSSQPPAIEQLYEHYEGDKLRLVCILPSGIPSARSCSAGNVRDTFAYHRGASVDHAISADGSRIFWSSYQGNPAAGAPLYVRIDGAQTIEISPDDNTFFTTAAADGSVAIYTVPGVSGNSLREFNVDRESTNEIADSVQGVLGAGDDASRIYFVSKEALGGQNSGGEEAQPGQANLYLYRRGDEATPATYTFIATLAAQDASVAASYSPVAGSPDHRTSRVSGDGNHALFTSYAPLTGYDNTDLDSGEADTEVFLYSASSGELACVSCNPSGARPAGRSLSHNGEGSAVTIAAAGMIRGWEYQLHAGRNLAADGDRVFFESFEGLVLRDTNAKKDVYEWERASGEAQCKELGAELYVAASGGCLSLISSGLSAADSEFIDAGADGRDVFFTTQSSLLPQDNGLQDLYDARAGGGFAQPSTPAACEGEACQGLAAAPNDPTPASSSFQGAGNVVEPAPTKCAKGKARRGGKCVKRHKTKQNRRANHHRRAGR